MYTDISSSIKVGAVFDAAKITPRWFIWKNKKYDIKKITYKWKDKEGEAELIYFSVMAEEILFEICLNKKNMEWTLVRSFIE